MFAIIAVLTLIPRPHGRKLLSMVTLISTDRVIGALVLVLGALGLAISHVASGDNAWLAGLLLPFAIAGLILILAWLCLIHPSAWAFDKLGVGTRVFALASVVFSFAIVPVLTWQIFSGAAQRRTSSLS